MNRHHIDIRGNPIKRQRHISPLAALAVYLIGFPILGVLLFGVFSDDSAPPAPAIAPAVNWTALPTTCGEVSQ